MSFSRFEDLKSLYTNARDGNIIYIPLNAPGMFDRLDRYEKIFRQRYTIVGGETGTGKTSLAHQKYLLWPYHWYLSNKDRTDIEFEAHLYSMERPWNFIMSKWISWRLLWKYKQVVSAEDLMMGHYALDNTRLPADLYDSIWECTDYYEKAMQYIHIIPGRINPTGILKQMEAHAFSEGNIVEDKTTEKQYYKPDNPKKINIVMIDHFGNLKNEAQRDGTYYTEKQLIKLCSGYLAEIRDKFGFSPVGVQMLNRGIGDIQRRIHTDLTPSLDDFKASSDTQDDCDFAITLFNPWRRNLTEWKGYHTNLMVGANGNNRFRGYSILKNSYGIDDIHIGMQFIGESGAFAVLPKAVEMTADSYKHYKQLGNFLS